MKSFRPECARLDEKGQQWVGVHFRGEGTRWQPMPKNLTIVRPPPGDLRCEVCQRAPGEVAHYGGPGDPLEGDYSEALLVKRQRSRGLLGSSWECRECVLLSDEEYLSALRVR
jgi:hypothetical protein